MASRRNRFTTVQRELLRTDVARLRCQGLTQQQIAERLTGEYRKKLVIGPGEVISRPLVQYYWKAVMDDWRRRREDDVEEYGAAQLAAIDLAMAEAWQAWHASKEGVTTTERTQSDDGTERVKVSKRKDAGDPRHLQQVLAALDRRATLLGLNAPTRTEVSGLGGNPLEVVAFDYASAIAPVLTDKDDDQDDVFQ